MPSCVGGWTYNTLAYHESSRDQPDSLRAGSRIPVHGSDQMAHSPRYEARLDAAWRDLIASGTALGKERGRTLGE